MCGPGAYLDGQCVQYQKPMLEGGTEGNQGHTEVVVPHMTESYGKDTKSPTKSIPMCTLKNFPYRIEHTLQVLSTKPTGSISFISEFCRPCIDKLCRLCPAGLC